MMMISLAQKDQAYQLFLSQGVLFGIGIACLYAHGPPFIPLFLPPSSFSYARLFFLLPLCRFNPSVAVAGHWFRRHRATAIGIIVSGGAVGGIVFPILLQHLIPLIGFGWSVRIIGFLIMACFIVACLTIRTRLPLSGDISLRTAVDLRGFRDARYVLATVAGFLYVYLGLMLVLVWSTCRVLGLAGWLTYTRGRGGLCYAHRLSYAYFIPYFYIQIYASFRGVDPAIASYLLAIMNAMNIPARILPGMLADRFGP